MRTSLLLLALLTVLGGCETVHLESGAGIPIAWWTRPVITTRPVGISNAGGSMAPRNDEPAKPSASAALVADSLNRTGMRIVFDEGGIAISNADELKAREALLLDPRLVGKEIGVILMVGAGCGRVSELGVVVTELGPPSTAELKEPVEPPGASATTGSVTIDPNGKDHDDDEEVPIAFSMTALRTATASRPPATLPDQDKIERVLRTANLHPTFKDGGISVPRDEAQRARVALVAGPKLASGDLYVVFTVPAGSGRRVETGFDIPNIGLESEQ